MDKEKMPLISAIPMGICFDLLVKY